MKKNKGCYQCNFTIGCPNKSLFMDRLIKGGRERIDIVSIFVFVFFLAEGELKPTLTTVYVLLTMMSVITRF